MPSMLETIRCFFGRWEEKSFMQELEKILEEIEEGCIIDDEAGNRAVEIIEKGGLN